MNSRITISCYQNYPNRRYTTSKKSILGSIKDEEGNPIIGANVVEKGTTNGTITNIDGQFSLNVFDNAILVVSYVGIKNNR